MAPFSFSLHPCENRADDRGEWALEKVRRLFCYCSGPISIPTWFFKVILCWLKKGVVIRNSSRRPCCHTSIWYLIVSWHMLGDHFSNCPFSHCHLGLQYSRSLTSTSSGFKSGCEFKSHDGQKEKTKKGVRDENWSTGHDVCSSPVFIYFMEKNLFNILKCPDHAITE